MAKRRSGSTRKRKGAELADFGSPVIWTLPQDELARLFKASRARNLKHPVRIIPEALKEAVGETKN